jgi:hypothetical protein
MAKVFTVAKDRPDYLNWSIPGKELQMMLDNPAAGI